MAVRLECRDPPIGRQTRALCETSGERKNLVKERAQQVNARVGRVIADPNRGTFDVNNLPPPKGP
jgi:hypothetical protein